MFYININRLYVSKSLLSTTDSDHLYPHQLNLVECGRWILNIRVIVEMNAWKIFLLILGGCCRIRYLAECLTASLILFAHAEASNSIFVNSLKLRKPISVSIETALSCSPFS